MNLAPEFSSKLYLNNILVSIITDHELPYKNAIPSNLMIMLIWQMVNQQKESIVMGNKLKGLNT